LIEAGPKDVCSLILFPGTDYCSNEQVLDHNYTCSSATIDPVLDVLQDIRWEYETPLVTAANVIGLWEAVIQDHV